MDRERAMGILEGILFSAGDPVAVEDLVKALEAPKEEVMRLINDMKQEYNSKKRGIMISEVGEKVRLTTKPDIYPYIETIFKPRVKSQLSRAALETLAIIMFKQPITKTEIEAIRGVNVEKTLNSLLEKNLICEMGRLEAPGRPILYGTTQYCLEYFGLNSIEELTKLELSVK
ncbi:SMC-Scp complex subunit ScpB [Thermosediminibacter oceani]|uniref:Chromosome segregation and condensation protein, ScpB n=1 Tax=Thermosediminibacter oceani (strain ATCC BAA-1034 / DSM 16646 / JW/IW-1228P) TaxID=555079 RepID=D9S3C4_THEOJ|nr:SMC-Scp complex subunit ScpB [Thermosediminibacter oceani]ADL07901.1 chromosome segregation and condensation protein, ScpB [Thermosediminibacter oceani DSM 16646]